MGKIVYHGTVSDEPPHKWGAPFHAGTMRAADDRLDDEISHGVDWDEVGSGIASVYAYEISDTAPMSKRVWSDPDIGFDRATYEREGDDAPTPEVPEHKTNRIYPYKNMREDRGSTSYVIPSNFVGTHVKHLGKQFQYVIGGREQENSVMNAITAMSGGKVK